MISALPGPFFGCTHSSSSVTIEPKPTYDSAHSETALIIAPMSNLDGLKKAVPEKCAVSGWRTT